MESSERNPILVVGSVITAVIGSMGVVLSAIALINLGRSGRVNKLALALSVSLMFCFFILVMSVLSHVYRSLLHQHS